MRRRCGCRSWSCSQPAKPKYEEIRLGYMSYILARAVGCAVECYQMTGIRIRVSGDADGMLRSWVAIISGKMVVSMSRLDEHPGRVRLKIRTAYIHAMRPCISGPVTAYE